jgi:hypothetical protein
MSDASLGAASTCWRSRVKAKRVNQCDSVVDAQAGPLTDHFEGSGHGAWQVC